MSHSKTTFPYSFIKVTEKEIREKYEGKLIAVLLKDTSGGELKLGTFRNKDDSKGFFEEIDTLIRYSDVENFFIPTIYITLRKP